MPAQNLVINSEDGSQASWTKNTGVTATADSTDVPPPVAGMRVTKLVYDGSGVAASYRFFDNGLIAPPGQTGTVTVWLRTLSGTATLRLGQNYNISAPFTVTTTWQPFSFTDTVLIRQIMQFLIYSNVADNSAFTVYATAMQRELANARGDYVKTGATIVDTGAPANKRLGQNLVTFSDTLTNAIWTQVNATPTGGQTDPLGGTSAFLITAGAGGVVNHALNNIATLPAATYPIPRTMTVTAIVKQGTARYCFVGGGAHSSFYRTFFDFTTNTIAGNDAGVVGAAKPLTGYPGWYVVSATYTVPAGTTNAALEDIWIGPTPNAVSSSYTQAGETVIVWRTQLELTDASGDHVPTLATAVP